MVNKILSQKAAKLKTFKNDKNKSKVTIETNARNNRKKMFLVLLKKSDFSFIETN